MADDDLDLYGELEKYRRERAPSQISVPTDVSEDEAVRAVQEQFERAGFECPEEQAREIVREAWGNDA